jgi:hypothetical protein
MGWLFGDSGPRRRRVFAQNLELPLLNLQSGALSKSKKNILVSYFNQLPDACFL